MPKEPFTILLIEPSSEKRQVICQSLTIESTRPLVWQEAITGAAALELYHSHPPQLIILSSKLPDMTALTFLKKIQSEYTTISEPTIVLTPDVSYKDIKRLWRMGVQDIVHDEDLKNGYLSRTVNHAIKRSNAYRKIEKDRSLQFRHLAEALPQIVWKSDAEGNLIYLNRRWNEYTGISSQGGLMQDSRQAAIHPEDQERVLKTWADALKQGEMYETEMRLRSASGEYRWHLSRSVPIKNEEGEIEKWFGTSTDIENQKQAAQLLEYNTKQLRNVIDNLLAFVDVITPSGILVEVNRTALAAAQLAAEDVLHKPFEETYWWSYDPKVQAQLRQAIQTAAAGQTVRYDVKVRVADDNFIIIDFMIVPIFDENKEVERLIASAIDISERIEAQEELRKSENRFRVAFEEAAVGVALLDMQGRWLQVNNYLCHIMGYTHDELYQLTFKELTHPDDIDIGIHQLQRLRQGDIDSWSTQKRYIHKDGSTIWADLSTSVIRDSITYEPQSLISIIQDITEQKEAERRLRLLAEVSGLLSTSINYLDTLQSIANLMTTTICDWCAIHIKQPDGTAKELVLAHVDPHKIELARTLQERYPPDPATPTGAQRVINTGEAEYIPLITDEMLVQGAQDEEHLSLIREIGLSSVMVIPFVARKDKVLGALTLVWSKPGQPYSEIDVQFAQELCARIATAVETTQLFEQMQEAQEDLKISNETLEMRIQERTAELQRSNEELDQFAYVASHDLKAPLRAIDHLSTWIQEDAREFLPPKSRQHLIQLNGRVKRMENLLEDLLTYSRVGRKDGYNESIDTRALVENVIALVAPPDNFTFTVQADMPQIISSRAPLETIFRNLIENALKHHDRADGHITVTAEEQGDLVKFYITDDGPGIDELFYERIFQMFQTLKPRDQVEGSGMGLAIVKKIVELRGGTISVASQVGLGTTFYFTWPIKPQS